MCPFIYLFLLLYIEKNAKKLDYIKGFCGDSMSLRNSRAFIVMLALFLCLIDIQKQQKHANNQKSQKNIFIINLDFQSNDPIFIFFLNQITINFNSTLSLFFF